VNWFLESVPESVYATGGTYFHKEDNRNVPDHIYCTFEYPNHITLTYSAIQTNAHEEYYEMYLGTQGTLVMSGENQSYLFWESGFEPDLAKRATEMSIENEAAGPAGAGPTQQPRRNRPDEDGRGREDTNSDMNALEPYRIQLEGFAHSIRVGAPNLCDGKTGMGAAVAAIAANRSIATEKKETFKTTVV
jgi:predicted dehydrogenase